MSEDDEDDEKQGKALRRMTMMLTMLRMKRITRKRPRVRLQRFGHLFIPTSNFHYLSTSVPQSIPT